MNDFKTEIKNVPLMNNGLHEVRIAFTGKMRAGKDSSAYALMKCLKDAGYHINHVTFGDELKRHAKALFPHMFYQDRKPRELFQWFGQTMRSMDENIWVNKVASNIEETNIWATQHTSVTHVAHIITDLRQPNEYQFCKENGFYIIKVHCDDNKRIERIKDLSDDFTMEQLNHETETHIDTFDTDYQFDTTNLDITTMEGTMYSFGKILLRKRAYGGQ